MNKELRKAKTIISLGTISVAEFLASIALFLYLIFNNLFPYIFHNWGFDVNANIALVTQSQTLFYIAIALGVFAFFLSIIGVILVLSTTFNVKAIDDQKILYGVLSLFVLHGIGLIIFGAFAMSKLKHESATR